MMRVEELISDTYPVWAGMRQALWEDHTEEKDRRQFQEYLARRQAGEALSYFAVSDNGDYTGFLDAALRVDHVDGVEHPPVWYVEGIFVVPEARGKGVGRFLCSVLERHARVQGYMMIASDCELDDYESEAFHKAIGFEEAIRSIHLTKSLDTDASEATEFEADSVPMTLDRQEFPLSGKYDPAWVFENQMGINALWLTEWLCDRMDLQVCASSISVAAGPCPASFSPGSTLPRCGPPTSGQRPGTT